MKPNDKASTKIKLTKTFFDIQSGDEKVTDAIARKRAERDSAKAEALKKGKPVDKTDPFMRNFGR